MTSQEGGPSDRMEDEMAQKSPTDAMKDDLSGGGGQESGDADRTRTGASAHEAPESPIGGSKREEGDEEGTPGGPGIYRER